LFLNLVAAVLRHRLFKAAWLSGTTALSACRLARRLSYPHPLLGWVDRTKPPLRWPATPS